MAYESNGVVVKSNKVFQKVDSIQFGLLNPEEIVS